MTRYAEIADFGLAGVDSTIISEIGTSDANRHLDMASSLADSYLQRVCDTPLVSWGDDLRQCVCRLAAYDLVVVNAGLPPNISPIDTIWKTNYDLAIDWLTGISKGEISPTWLVTGSNGSSTATTTKPIVRTKTALGWGDLL